MPRPLLPTAICLVPLCIAAGLFAAAASLQDHDGYPDPVAYGFDFGWTDGKDQGKPFFLNLCPSFVHGHSTGDAIRQTDRPRGTGSLVARLLIDEGRAFRLPLLATALRHILCLPACWRTRRTAG